MWLLLLRGGIYSFALRYDGTMVCWGDNWVNQCGAPEETDDAVEISAAYAESLVLKADGTLRCSGNGRVWGSCDIPPDLGDNYRYFNGLWLWPCCKIRRHNGLLGKKRCRASAMYRWGCTMWLPLLVGMSDSLALKENGSVVAWGGRRVQPVRHRMVPPGLGKLTAIDTRGNESNTVDMGLRQDGTAGDLVEAEGWLVVSGKQGIETEHCYCLGLVSLPCPW